MGKGSRARGRPRGGFCVKRHCCCRLGNQFVELADGARLRRPRGWLMRRLLLAADLVGLTVAFVVALTLAPIARTDTVGVKWELLLFLCTLPLWVLLARLHGLYDRDEGRSDHSTVDDVVGIIQVVTLGTWGSLAITYFAGLPHPTLDRLVQFWLIAIVLVSATPRRGADDRAQTPRLRPERRHRRFGSGRAPARGQDARSPRIRPERRRVRRQRRWRVDERVRPAPPAREDAGAARPRPEELDRPRRHRVLTRLARADARGDPGDAGPRCPGRHRSTHVRGAWDERAAAHRRGAPARRALTAPALVVVPAAQAVARRHRRLHRACAARAPVCRRRRAHQARLSWARSSSDKCEWARASGPSVSSSSGRWSRTPRA